MTTEQLLDEIERLKKTIAEMELEKTGLEVAQTALRHDEERFRSLFDNSPLGYQSLDADGRMTEVNKAWLETLKYERSEVIGRWFGEFLTPEYVAPFKRQFEEFKKTGGIHSVEIDMTTKSGEIVQVAFDGQVGYDSAGEFRQTHCIMRNITELKRSAQATKDSEVLFQTIFEQAGVGVAQCCTKSGRFLRVNKIFCDLFNCSAEDLASKTLDKLFSPNELEISAKACEPYDFAAEGGFSKEVKRFTKNGSTVWIHLTVSPLSTESGGSTGMIIIAQNVTYQKLAKEALRESEERYRRLVESSLIPVVVTTLDDSKILFVNKAAADYFGASIEELLIGNTSGFWANLDERTRFASLIKKHGKVENFQAELKHHSGVSKWILLSAGKIHFDGQEAIFGLLNDITDRVMWEEAIKRKVVALTQPLNDPESIRFSDLFDVDEIQNLQDIFAEAAGVSSLITYPDGTPITRPSNFCRLCKDIIRKTEVGLANCYLSDALLGKLNTTGPTIQPCLSGGIWDAGASITVGGKHIANWLVGQVRDADLDEEEMLEYADKIGVDRQVYREALAEVNIMSREQFDKVANAVFAFAKELSVKAYQNVQQARFLAERERNEEILIQTERFRAVADLAAGVAHNFNNLLQIVLGSCNLAMINLETGDLAALKANIEQIMEHSKFGAETVRRLNTFARMGANSHSSATDFDLSILAREAAELTSSWWKTDLEKKGIKVSLDMDLDRECIVHGHKNEIFEVVVNIIKNAAEAIHRDGQISIRSVTRNNLAKLVIQDTGVGIPEKDQSKLFTPFFTTKSDTGTGLGLATSRRIVEDHRGKIDIESNEHQGATVTIWLPLARDHEGQEAQHSDTETIKDVTILVIDDIEPVLQTVGMALEHYNYSVLTAQSGIEGLNLLEQNSADLVICDLGMPGMNGWEVGERIATERHENGMKKLPFILLTGWGDQFPHEQSVNSGVDAVIEKPVDIIYLNKVIQDLVRQNSRK